MASTPRRTALITGASHGIGYELARLFAKGGYDVVLVARDKESLEQGAAHLRDNFGVQATVLVKDLGVPGNADDIVRILKEQGIGIDVLVNNAGFGLYGRFAETDLDRERGMIQLNMMVLTELTKLLLPGMLERKWGRILNLASTAAFQPGPLMAVYYATKAYVLSLSQALAYELKGTGVSVTALCPGPTKSGFQKEARLEASRLFRGKIMDAETVAEIGYRGLMRRKLVVVPGLRNKFLAFMTRFTPRRLALWAVWQVQKEEKQEKQ